MSHGRDSLDMMPKTQATKVKIDKLSKNFKKILCIKGHSEHYEKVTFGMKENIHISYI